MDSQLSTTSTSAMPVDQQFDSGVRVLSDGRLDIELNEHRPFFRKLIQHLERSPKPVHTNLEPSTVQKEEKEPFPLRLNIVIQVVGSRGDIQPFIALGKELQRNSHRIRLATHLKFRNEIRESGLEFFDIGGDPEQLMAFMVQNPGLMPGVNAIKSGAIRQRRREMRSIFSGCWRSCFETGDGTGLRQMPDNIGIDATENHERPFVADVIIANPPSFAHISCAEKLGIPLHMMFTMPWSPTRSFPHPLASVRSRGVKASVANFASYALVEVMIWDGLGDLINNFRKNDLALDPLDLIQGPGLANNLKIPYTYLWSPALLPKPEDWSHNIDICGFQFLTSETDYQAPHALQEFLDGGEPPIYIGFGSIVVKDPLNLTLMIFEAVQQTGQRAIISKGWSNIGVGMPEARSDIFLLDNCPHEWLFPRVSCVVHHGGAGTTAAGLLASRPTVVIPFFGDQPFWGSIIAQAGAGPPPVPYKKLTATNLASAISTALEPLAKTNAENIGKKMRMENGVQDAVKSFHHHLNIEKSRCSICPHKPAVWWHRRSRIKLSAFAASVLVHTGHVDPHDLVMYRPLEYDTGRDPRGPLSAGAEVIYGLVTDIVVGLVRVPIDISCYISGKQPVEKLKNRTLHDWALTHFLDTSSKKAENTTSESSEDERGDDLPVEEHPESGNNYCPCYTTGNIPVTGSENMDNSTEVIYHSPDREKQLRMARTKQVFTDTGHYTGRIAKQFLDLVLRLPTDFALSLTKGFHNAPKLYNDSTVKEFPVVRSIKSGIRAAATEFTQEFYDGITGLIVQPIDAVKEYGGKGLIPGTGKGLGGAFLKPMTGIVGIAGLPLDGLHKTLRDSISKSKLKDIIQSRIVQGIEEMSDASIEERQKIIQQWDEMRR
ncbi:putative UDP-glucose,sterol transferase [Talaromyces proteolyticus]|uniref:UDP-glucose,sterol transferase n=1 Tax=Talaromyces proteolyticus TaxID=1131652 RepID=A0AAD4Q143_9EURO|nr:putative UDP-glucose,sterol transferase [Talaromyces proteolyticus]KAH8705220.1 putative UDP-glucose,sterol transferase [Talaromyces proteolyticus]